MNENLFSLNDPVTFESGSGDDAAYMTDQELIEFETEVLTVSSGDSGGSTEGSTVVIPDNLLTEEVYLQGVDDLINVIDSDSVNEEVQFVDYGTFYRDGVVLPDYAVVFACNGIEVIFPTEYADQVLVVDGLLINLGSSYTAGLEIDGYAVNNYLSSELTIPTYHSSTWYQYLQSYGQPYRIVDRYVNTNGNISSSTRTSVNVEWSGGNPWAGFTFDRAAMFIVIAVLVIMLVFRKGSR